MITANENTFDFTLRGNDVKPSSFKAKEIAIVIENLEYALRDIIYRDHPELDPDKIYISLVDVEESSNKLKFLPSVKEFTLSALAILGSAISQNDFSEIPYTSFEPLRNIQGIVRQHECFGTFSRNGTTFGTITPVTNFSVPRNLYLQGETTLYGIIQRVGGVEPKVRIRTAQGQTLSLDASLELAKQVATKLYEEVGFNGVAKWSKKDHSLFDFKIKSIINYQPTSITKSFEELRGIIGKYWDKIDNIDEALLQ